MLQVENKKVQELGPEDRAAWRRLRAADPGLASPYFSLGFVEAVSRVRNDVRVLVARENNEIIAFLPLQVGILGHARPVGGPFGDHHGLIAAPGQAIDLKALLSAGGISVFDFFGVPGHQRAFRAGAQDEDGSWVIDLSDGYEAFVETRSAIEPKAFRNLRSRQNKLEKADGGYVFRPDDRREEVFETALAWKSAQYVRTGHFDAFSVDWTRNLLKTLVHDEGEDCHGLVSSLEIGGRLAAIHVGMRSSSVLHYWFPVYDPEFSSFGPGLALLMKICEHVSQDGIAQVHLGPGEYAFKSDLASWQIPLLSGYVATTSLLGAARTLANGIDASARALPLGPVSTLPGRAMRRLDRMTSFRPA
ncbi:GNAT family N-acetyltransferase [Marinicauda pacifica]|uniref:GNAT family N-acetyltransferase n=1 Tax=Marinicauda pacifica TaxID=1133559 RepID=UPI0035C7DA4B